MDWAAGYASAFRLMSVDHVTWADAAQVAGLSGLSAAASVDGDAPAIDSADATLDRSLGGDGYVRAWMDAEQDGEVVRVPIGTYLAQASMADGEPTSTARVELYSVLQPAAERLLAAGWYAPAGSHGPTVAGELLAAALDAPVSVSSGEGGELGENMVSAGESYLSMAWALCGDGWEIVTDGMGNVTVRPRPTSATPIPERAIIGGGISTSWDLAGVPNVVIATDGTTTAEAVNDDPASPTSTVSRGRRIEASASGTRLADETLQAFAERSLSEMSTATETAEYEREWVDGVRVGDRVTLPGHEGSWRVMAQQVKTGCGATIQETATREMTTYA
uniref:Uncharacterized protein n=1 Tax=uncultured bacterium Contig1770 TaxID=1393510 RepID=W0FHR8_9BACT|nr:hypothetical protein [uncultured bacterium Contig1770]